MSISSAIYYRVQRVAAIVRRCSLSAAGAQFEGRCLLSAGIVVRRGMDSGTPGSIIIGDQCELQTGVVLDAWGGSIALGKNTFLGPYVVMYGHGGITVGDNTLIAMHCCIVSANHGLPAAGTLIRSCPDEKQAVHIGSDVWVGAGVRILAGVTIGDGCVIGAGSVVTSDLEPNRVALGVPAQVVRKREKTA